MLLNRVPGISGRGARAARSWSRRSPRWPRPAAACPPCRWGWRRPCFWGPCLLFCIHTLDPSGCLSQISKNPIETLNTVTSWSLSAMFSFHHAHLDLRRGRQNSNAIFRVSLTQWWVEKDVTSGAGVRANSYVLEIVFLPTYSLICAQLRQPRRPSFSQRLHRFDYIHHKLWISWQRKFGCQNREHLQSICEYVRGLKMSHVQYKFICAKEGSVKLNTGNSKVSAKNPSA